MENLQGKNCSPLRKYRVRMEQQVYLLQAILEQHHAGRIGREQRIRCRICTEVSKIRCSFYNIDPMREFVQIIRQFSIVPPCKKYI